MSYETIATIIVSLITIIAVIVTAIVVTRQEKKLHLKSSERKSSKTIEELPQHKIIPITGPITHPKQFFGREDILERIFSNWQELPLEHVAITGPEGSGKTSLLNYLRLIHNCNDLRKEQRNNWLEQKYNFMSVDFENIAVHSLEGFLRYVLKELNLHSNTKDLDDLTETLNNSLNRPTIILMDNIEFGLEISELDKRFWQYIRYLGNKNSNLGFCITSNIPIEDLNKWAEEIGKTSPAFNIYEDIKLEPLTENEAQEFLNYVPFSQSDKEWILEKGQRWPALLQIFCKVRFDYKDDWKEIGLKQIKRLSL
ncbi:AAA family ATPase [Candidatus Halobeggiatoa sp. HSG11]|nr:AAA family ATPase [Candidatus Halobeggiatoa sp. HSG11]